MGANLQLVNLGTGASAVEIAFVGRLNFFAEILFEYCALKRLSTSVSGRTAESMAMGMFFVCAMLSEGGVACWGLNTYGSLGTGTTTTVGNAPGEMGNSLVQVQLGAGVPVQNLIVESQSMLQLTNRT